MMKIDFVDTGWMPLMLLEISDDIAKIDGDMRMTSQRFIENLTQIKICQQSYDH